MLVNGLWPQRSFGVIRVVLMLSEGVSRTELALSMVVEYPSLNGVQARAPTGYQIKMLGSYCLVVTVLQLLVRTPRSVCSASILSHCTMDNRIETRDICFIQLIALAVNGMHSLRAMVVSIGSKSDEVSYGSLALGSVHAYRAFGYLSLSGSFIYTRLIHHLHPRCDPKRPSWPIWQP